MGAPQSGLLRGQGRFDLNAQVVVRVIAKVADAYKLDRKRQRTFRRHGAIAYDDRNLRYGTDHVSLWTETGRRRIVAEAQRTKRAIALEDLHGIRDRVRVRRPQRATLHAWSFSQLRSFIEYKAKLAGVRVILVDPRNTSRTCPACGHCAKENRPNQATSLCQSCGLAGLADLIAAVNVRLRGWAAVNQPNANAVGLAS